MDRRSINSIDKGLIPIWHKGVSEEDNHAKLDRYINDLEILRDCQLQISDRALILLSLNKSGRTDLLQNISLDIINEIGSFIDFIKNAYGRSDMDLRSKLEDVRRETSESMYSYLNRVVRLYFKCHQRPPMTINELSLSAESSHERSEIIYYFLRGLGNKKVVEQIKLNLGTNLTFVELPDLSKRLFEIFGEEKGTINNVTEELQEFEITDENGTEDYSNVNNADEDDQLNYESEDDRDFDDRNVENDYCYNCDERHWARKFTNRKKSYRGRCYECGEYGHKAYQCNQD